MTKLSININKFATLRNARGGNNPNIISIALDCERFGAQGITVHPRPDERHIRYRDALDLSKILSSEFNIEGYPDSRYMQLIKDTRPAQATLVPDPPDTLTSNTGWDTLEHQLFLKDIIAELKSYGVRVSVFLNPDIALVEAAAQTGADRIELYTEPYATHYPINPDEAVSKYVAAAHLAHQLGLGINAGHDLSLINLAFLKKNIPHLAEVSIGHALVCDSLYLGLQNTIQLYLRELA